MAKREALRIPLDFETTVKALLQTPPPPPDVTGSRKESKPKARKRKAPKPARGSRALAEESKRQMARLSGELSETLRQQPKARKGTKRKVAKKR